jgi:hypothetical protein
MAQEKAKGSIFYELLIVILAAVLIASIIYPKKVTEKAERDTKICREKMSDILNAELQYQKYNDVYTDTLSKVIEFLKTSPEYAAYIDTVMKRGLDSVLTKLNEFKMQEETILANIPAALDSTMIDSLSNMQEQIKMDSRQLAGFVEYLHDRMKNLPNTPTKELKSAFVIVDSKQFTLDMDIVRNSIQTGDLKAAQKTANDVIDKINFIIEKFELVINKLPEYKSDSLDSLYNCPTVNKPYRLVYVDTSAIKYLNIYCPIDSTDIEAYKSNFLMSTIGGVELKNHGYIEKGEKSWEQRR